jgi:O-antigen/teichoic acid export membrane protein
VSALLSRIADKLQVDRTLLYALSTRVWQAMAGPITIVFLIRSLSIDEQGVYYALATLMTIQLFFELGLLNVLISQSGHQISAVRHAENDEQLLVAKDRMGQLIYASFKWFLGASVIYAIAAMFLGWQMLSARHAVAENWLPLVCLSVIAAATVALSPLMAILEGAGFRNSIYRMRFIQMVSGGLVVWLSLWSHLKIWTLVTSALVQLLCGIVLVRVIHKQDLDCYRLDRSRSEVHPAGMSWFKEVLPLQWRMALISVAYHVATQFFPVILFLFHGKAEAGQLGMTLTGTAAIQGMALAWIQTNYSVVSSMHGAGDREAAGTLWRKLSIVSTVLLVSAFVVATLVVAALPFANRGWESHFIKPWQIAVLGLGCLANHWIATQIFYVLSRKGKPFLLASLAGSIATLAAVLYGGYWYSVSGIVLGYSLVMCLLTLPLHSYFYLKYRMDAGGQ